MVCITRTHFSCKCGVGGQIPPKNMENLEESGDLHGMLEPQNGFVGRNKHFPEIPCSEQVRPSGTYPDAKAKGFFLRHVQHQLVFCFGNRSAISGFLLRSDSFTGGIPKSDGENMPRGASRQTRKLGGGEVVCKPQPPWSWLGLVSFGGPKTAQPHPPTLKPTCETCWNWPGITSWSLKSTMARRFLSIQLQGEILSKEIHPPEQKQQPNFSRLLVFSPSPSMGELPPSACFKLGCYPAAPRLWPPRLHA